MMPLFCSRLSAALWFACACTRAVRIFRTTARFSSAIAFKRSASGSTGRGRGGFMIGSGARRAIPRIEGFVFIFAPLLFQRFPIAALAIIGGVLFLLPAVAAVLAGLELPEVAALVDNH